MWVWVAGGDRAQWAPAPGLWAVLSKDHHMLVAPSPPAKLFFVLQGLWTGGPRARLGLQASLGRVPGWEQDPNSFGKPGGL